MPAPAPNVRVLVIDDDAAMRDTLADGLRAHDYDVVASDANDAPRLVRDASHDVLVTDLRMPEIDGISLLTLSKQIVPERPVVVMTAFGAVDTAVDSLRKGAFHYLLKPFKVAELDLVIGRALEERALRRETRTLRRALRQRFALDQLVTRSSAMRQVRELIERIADAEVPTLLVGETGTGKGMFARALHAESNRASAPFVSVNCAALPENLLESELFGHVRGAFTGAHADRQGLFEQADGGMIFLDEIGDMVPALQAKLLDVLERRCIRAVGASRERPVDVRVIAATHRDLRGRIAAGLFREDLLYRLEGVVVEIPPLRQRRDDLPPLVERFVAEARASNAKAVVERFSHEAMLRILDYAWPGNVRELENAVGRAVLLGRTVEALPGDLPAAVAKKRSVRATFDFGEEIVPVRELQRRYAASVLERLGGRKTLACEKLGIDAKTLNKWLAIDESTDE
ncbi:MAG: Response regulator of zinc sigma-54-dependent two-component system [Labilithrix sp.]|nr:Response regulator of zinc sigma-54-dependent two-component system [Labilithrix sp.]